MMIAKTRSGILLPGIFMIACLLCSCAGSKKSFDPDRKFDTTQLKKDYTLFRNILEEEHPGLYWYTPKDTMDYYFDKGFAGIKDSMTEPQFRAVLSYTISKINCGHTTTRNSKQFSKYLDTARFPLFPIAIKFLKDTAVVTANMNRRDTGIRAGQVVYAINNVPINIVRDSLTKYVSADGYNTTHKRQSISNGYAFGAYYKTAYGNVDKFSIDLADSGGNRKMINVPLYKRIKDSTFKREEASIPKPTRKMRRMMDLAENREFVIDTAKSTAIMEVNTFTSGKRLKHFFKKSFRKIHHMGLKNVVIDVRNNGGGNVSNSTLLTRYLIDEKFKLADSLYARHKKSKYGKYINNSLIMWPFMTFITSKRDDGYYHFGYYERHYFKPHKHNHFDGNIYVLIGGNSFSATALFSGALKGQKNVCIIGEETGGGQYGNCAWFIPDVILPNTRIRFRLPKFRLVISNSIPKNGRGIMPDVEVVPTTTSIGKGEDLKMAKAIKLIDEKNKQASN